MARYTVRPNTDTDGEMTWDVIERAGDVVVEGGFRTRAHALTRAAELDAVGRAGGPAPQRLMDRFRLGRR
jgi:hypothetical protein